MSKHAMTAQDAAGIGRIGGLSVVAKHGPDAIAARARAGLWRKFCREADPDGVLSETERTRRAELVQRAYYARLAKRSADSRRRRSRKGDGDG